MTMLFAQRRWRSWQTNTEKNHPVLADDLERAISDESRRPGAGIPLVLHPLPKGRDDRPLMHLTKPRHDLEELVLPPGTKDLLDELALENLRSGVLADHSLSPAPQTAVRRAARHRQERGGGSDHGEMRRVTATVLQLLETTEARSPIIATSNHPRLMDAALWRRFDELVQFDHLDPEQAADLITLKLRAVESEIAAASWAVEMSDMSPAEIELTCYDAIRRHLIEDRPRLDDQAMALSVRRMRDRLIAARRATATDTV